MREGSAALDSPTVIHAARMHPQTPSSDAPSSFTHLYQFSDPQLACETRSLEADRANTQAGKEANWSEPVCRAGRVSQGLDGPDSRT